MGYNTQTQIDKRDQLRKVMDDFTTFSWGPHKGLLNAFEEFGAFIVGGKDALKFYNGPSFSNKYIQTQFQMQNSTLQSVEFKNMSITFTMGVYWFTIEEYRKLLLWLHPYEINSLSFSFAPKWYYLAKLSNISDSTRYILGKDENGEYRYYTEIKLTFDVQGEPCLHSFDAYSIQRDPSVDIGVEGDSSESLWCRGFQFTNKENLIQTDLDTPLEILINLAPTAGALYPSNVKWPSNFMYPQSFLNNVDGSEEEGFYVALAVEYDSTAFGGNRQTSSHLLFEAFLKHLSWNEIDGNAITILYDSAQGLLFLDGGRNLLSGQATSFSGRRIVEALNVKTFKLPGALEAGLPLSDFKNIRFKIYHSNNWKIGQETTDQGEKWNVTLLSRARTNVI